MAAVSRWALCWRDRLVALSVLDQDALLYLLASLLALGTIFLGESADYREWAEIAVGPYGGAALISFLVARFHARRPQKKLKGGDLVRRGVIVGLLVTVVVVPLSWEVVLRSENKPGDQVQNEVTVIEACAHRVIQHKVCYLTHPKNIGSSAVSGSEDSFFPYLPGMIVFGLIPAISKATVLKDARIPLTGFSLIVISGALLIAGVRSKRRWRIFQVVVVLPSGALPMVTGGDDLPVIALMLLALALATRRRPMWSGFAMGLAGSLKFTAWPLLVLLALGEWDRQGRRAILRYSTAVVAVVIPVLAVGMGSNWHAFVLNAIRFPLGLTRVKSPAASPLLGQELVKLFPSAKPELIVILGLFGIAVVLYGLRRWTPSTPQSAAGFSGLAMLFATVLAPATAIWLLDLPARPIDLRGVVDAALCHGITRGAPRVRARARGSRGVRDLEESQRQPHHRRGLTVSG